MIYSTCKNSVRAPEWTLAASQGEGNGNPRLTPSISCLESHEQEGACWAAVTGHEVGQIGDLTMQHASEDVGIEERVLWKVVVLLLSLLL